MTLMRPDPTAFPDLDDVLATFVEGVHAVLGERLVGLYLTGSFALGDADIHSDVDFVAAVVDELSAGDVWRLEALHVRMFQLPSHWAQHLEGSYMPVRRLRRKPMERETYVYFDNGATVAIQDEHDDTHVLRWTLRERGVILAGPAPATLVDPVSADELRVEMVPMLESYVSWAPEPSATGRMNRWKQTYLVATLCRIGFTIEHGRVPSKRASLGWAADAWPARWRPLIERAVADRPDPWLRVHQEADGRLVDDTLEFVEWVARTTAGSRPSSG